ncbi:ABC transporter permease [Anaerobacillus sp. CMMVII]|uniref:ABC transporter permease n=1 Tax=Anaerobacillus sp. CMMVII TaxID=2755588 RepID=UPI0028E09FAB|nr:ABC transporter permease [Anaerobacillus sp. CMMVII]
MDLFIEGIIKAFEMIITGDREIYEITFTTLKVSLTAIMVSTVVGIPLGVLLGLRVFPGKKIVLVFVNIGMGLPPVVAGLYITMLLWRSGPLGHLGLLYTTQAIILAQILVSLPIIIGLTSSAFQQIDSKMLLQIKALGATKFQRLGLLLRETKLAIFAAIMAGLGRVLAEVGRQ